MPVCAAKPFFGLYPFTHGRGSCQYQISAYIVALGIYSRCTHCESISELQESGCKGVTHGESAVIAWLEVRWLAHCHIRRSSASEFTADGVHGTAEVLI